MAIRARGSALLHLTESMGAAHSIAEQAWCQAGATLAQKASALKSSGSRQMWEVGDWLLVGETQLFRHLKSSKIRAIASGITGYSHHTLTMAVSVSRRIEPSMRIDGLSWWHHLAVAKLPAPDMSEWLTQAAENAWSVRKLRAEMTRGGVASLRPNSDLSTRLIHKLVELDWNQIPTDVRAELLEWCGQDSNGGSRTANC
jgi:hypothetical protein